MDGQVTLGVVEAFLSGLALLYMHLLYAYTRAHAHLAPLYIEYYIYKYIQLDSVHDFTAKLYI